MAQSHGQDRSGVCHQFMPYAHAPSEASRQGACCDSCFQCPPEPALGAADRADRGRFWVRGDPLCQTPVTAGPPTESRTATAEQTGMGLNDPSAARHQQKPCPAMPSHGKMAANSNLQRPFRCKPTSLPLFSSHRKGQMAVSTALWKAEWTSCHRTAR